MPAGAVEAAAILVIKGDGLVVESGQLGDSLLDVEEVIRLTGAPVADDRLDKVS